MDYDAEVVTRTASLLCEGTCEPNHVPHTFCRCDKIRRPAGDVSAVLVIFTCDQCGAERVWGQMGPE